MNSHRELAVIKQLQSLHGKDPEQVHDEAVRTLCEFLRSIGCEDVVEAFNEANKGPSDKQVEALAESLGYIRVSEESALGVFVPLEQVGPLVRAAIARYA